MPFPNSAETGSRNHGMGNSLLYTFIRYLDAGTRYLANPFSSPRAEIGFLYARGLKVSVITPVKANKEKSLPFQDLILKSVSRTESTAAGADLKG